MTIQDGDMAILDGSRGERNFRLAKKIVTCQVYDDGGIMGGRINEI